MATEHTVQQGEHLARIAARFGFRTIGPIWNHPRNRELRELRLTPHVLLPGDVVHVPDLVEKVVARATTASHVFRVARSDLALRVVVLDDRFVPAAGLECALDAAGVATVTTDATGLVSRAIPVDLADGQLTIGERVLPLAIGHLDPVTSVTGARARLDALGYFVGEGAEPSEPEFRSAIEEMQCDAGLVVNGTLDAATVDRLQSLFGA
ncbi:MAG: peptidoglycan-binding protein [Polyangiaceae bacterium]